MGGHRGQHGVGEHGVGKHGVGKNGVGRSMGREHGVVQWLGSLEAVGLTACERPGRENLKSGRTR